MLERLQMTIFFCMLAKAVDKKFSGSRSVPVFWGFVPLDSYLHNRYGLDARSTERERVHLMLTSLSQSVRKGAARVSSSGCSFFSLDGIEVL